jgi:phenylacetate-CoA ligase
MAVMPALRRALIEPAWAAASGTVRRRVWHEAERAQALPESALREQQWQRLREIIAFVYEHNDFYRRRFDEHGVSPDTLRSLDDLSRFPMLTKAEVRQQGTALVSRGFRVESLMQAKTGGSTGRPLEVYMTEAVSEARNAVGRRHLRWSGWEVGDPVARVWGNPAYAEALRDRLREWLLEPVIYLDTMAVTPDSVRAFARDWARMRPTLLTGHAHSVYVLAKVVDAHRITGIEPTGIITSSMMLVEHERKTIERVFGRRVFDLYGCEEVGLIGSECERHDGMHLNVEQQVVELLRDSGAPAGPGEAGHIVVTDLLNQAMPLIRYRMEDRADVRARPCPCGRGLPAIGRIVGRTADFLKRADGARIAGVSLIENTLTRIPGIDQMQVVQDELGRIALRVVPGPAFTPDRRRELVAYFEQTFPGASVELQDVAAIAPEANGKYRFSICRIPD